MTEIRNSKQYENFWHHTGEDEISFDIVILNFKIV